ncbi:hypothetical protein EZV73_19935 [Acidaminobacter sp. JC074]|uniref:hypothetical protein n=1 Tax=Acidaminobacter sp. JC074 TaxID=2530199 RepID=UPI001F0F8541|nr:hypothetical protein [Acidaminobacter sp. JC074]MCH4889863.1 hypothetical protein [Acidaminobacter sp. JC074]
MNKLERLEHVFKLQKENYSPANTMTYEKRMDILNRMDKMFRSHYKEITKVLQEDFGYRGTDFIFTAEFYPILSHISHVKKGLKSWMRKERTTSLSMALTGQREYIVNEPLPKM